MTARYPLGRHLDAATRHDPRSRAFPAATAPLRTVLHHHNGPVLDQGDIGSCTGNATAQALNCDPLRRPAGRRLLTEQDAVAIYSWATHHDRIPGMYPPEDTGSDGLSVAKAAKTLKLISGYTHAFGLDHALGALMGTPIIVGTKWTNDMFTPDADGFVHPAGDAAGGHEWCVIGVDVEHRYITAINSWGASWGLGGLFRVTFDDFGHLLSDGGDATVLMP